MASRSTSRQSPPVGAYVPRNTSQVTFPAPVVNLSGRFRDEVVYHTRGGKTFVRPYVRPQDPETPYQLDQRSRFCAAKAHWKTLTEVQREGWRHYAAEVYWPGRPASPRQLGPECHTSAQCQRQAWGDALRAEPPSAPPPPRPLSIEQVPAPAGMYAFQITHSLIGVTGIRVLLDMTPATPSLERAPREGELTRAGRSDLGSFFPLAESGSVYLLEEPRYDVPPGRRYGVRVRLLNDDGISGEPLTADLIRLPADSQID